MGSDAAGGVVDHRGRVYDPSHGPERHPSGLFVVDGSIIPTAVGVNPLLTISAGREKCRTHERRRHVGYDPKPFKRATYVESAAAHWAAFYRGDEGLFHSRSSRREPEDYRPVSAAAVRQASA